MDAWSSAKILQAATKTRRSCSSQCHGPGQPRSAKLDPYFLRQIPVLTRRHIKGDGGSTVAPSRNGKCRAENIVHTQHNNNKMATWLYIP